MALQVPTHAPGSTTAATARRGFSFTEILFAVMILGIGFIMVAAMFPVAIQQTQNSNDETVAAGIARVGVSTMNQVAQTNWPSSVPPDTITFPTPFDTTSMLTPTVWSTLQPTAFSATQPGFFLYPTGANLLPIFGGLTSYTIPGAVWSCCDRNDDGLTVTTRTGGGATVSRLHYQDLWSMLAPNLVQASDPRYAWVALWKRDLNITTSPARKATPAPYAQVILIGCRSRNTPTYSAVPAQGANLSDVSVQMSDGGVDASLVPSFGTGNIGAAPALGTSGITFADGTNAAARAAEGAYVIIANDGIGLGAQLGSTIHGFLNGHIYRLGTNTGTNTWEFAPGEGLTAGEITQLLSAGNPTFAVFVIGMGQDPNNPNGPRSGPAQDIAVYSTVVPCPN